MKDIKYGKAGIDVFYFNRDPEKSGEINLYLAKKFSPEDILFVDGKISQISESQWNVVVTLENGDRYYVSKQDGVTAANLTIQHKALATATIDPAATATIDQNVKVAIVGMGQSLMFGTNTTAISTKPIDNGWMIDWDNLNHDSVSPKSQGFGNSLGLVPYHNTSLEVQGAGVIEGFNSVTKMDVVFGNAAVGGKSIDFLTSGYSLHNMQKLIETIVTEIQSDGVLADTAFIIWEQGQGDTSTSVQEYKDYLLAAYNLYDSFFDAAAGRDITVKMGIQQVRSYSQGNPSQAQFELALENENIEIISTEPEFQFNSPASATDFTHVSGQGQFEKGFDAGEDLAKWLKSDVENKMVTVDSIVSIAPNRVQVNFSGVDGALFVGDFYNAVGGSLFTAPDIETFGAGFYNSQRTTYGAPKIISSTIIDEDTIEHVLDRPVQAGMLYNTSREHQDNSHGSWLSDDDGMIPFQYFEIT